MSGRAVGTVGRAAAGGPLAGIRVVELGSFIAGPQCGAILASYGAEVIKVEPAGGDQLRAFRDTDETGTSWWWRSLARNKKSVVLDLKQPGAQAAVRELCASSDVLLENFRPGRMEQFGLGPAEIEAVSPGIVYTRVSGYGQDGPYAPRPGFASACEAMGGLRYVNGFPDRPSVRPNLSMGDTLAGVHAALGTTLALFAKQKGNAGAGFQVVDASIYESVFAMLEGVLPDFDGAGVVRGPSGSTITGIVPSGTYASSDGKSVVIGANSDSLFKRLMRAMGRDDLADSDQYDDNQKRVEHQAFIDRTIAAWVAERTADEVCRLVQDAQVPNGLIYSIEDIVEDPQYLARGMIEEVPVPSLGRSLKIPGISPKLSRTPGRTIWAGPELGQHSAEVLFDILGYDEPKVRTLMQEGAVIWPDDVPFPES